MTDRYTCSGKLVVNAHKTLQVFCHRRTCTQPPLAAAAALAAESRRKAAAAANRSDILPVPIKYTTSYQVSTFRVVPVGSWPPSYDCLAGGILGR